MQNNHCHRVTTQLQLINIIIKKFHINVYPQTVYGEQPPRSPDFIRLDIFIRGRIQKPSCI